MKDDIRQEKAAEQQPEIEKTDSDFITEKIKQRPINKKEIAAAYIDYGGYGSYFCVGGMSDFSSFRAGYQQLAVPGGGAGAY